MYVPAELFIGKIIYAPAVTVDCWRSSVVIIYDYFGLMIILEITNKQKTPSLGGVFCL